MKNINNNLNQKALLIYINIDSLNRAEKLENSLEEFNTLVHSSGTEIIKTLKLYKKYWVEFSSRAKSANPLKENINEVKDPDVIAKIRDVVKNKQNKVIKDPVTKRNMRMDGFSASAIIQVYDAINTSNKKKFAKLPLLKMQSIAFKFVK